MQGRPLAVTSWGQICVDHIFRTGGAHEPRLGRELYADSYSTALGGGAGIVAVTLARLGLPSGLVSRVGADAAGIELLQQLRMAGVNVSHVEVLKDKATDISVAFTCPADRGFLSHMAASRALDTTGMESPCLARTRHLHLCLSHTESPEHWRGLIQQAHEVGTTVSVDLGWQTSWDRNLCRWLGEADLVFPNETEAMRIGHTRSIERAMQLLGAQGATIVVKRGGAGVSAYQRGRRIDMPPTPAREIVDTTGAGDMFAAGFLWAWVQGHSLGAALAAGSLCGARCVEQIGGLAIPPTVAELQTTMRATDEAVMM